jgi:predicted TPR repeat methyltransferase
MGRHGPQDDSDWRRVLRSLNSPLAHLPASKAGADYLSSHGHRRAAEAAYREVVEREPTNTDAVSGLAWLLELGGRSEEAAQYRRMSVAIEIERLGVPPEHRESATEFRLAALGGGPAPDRAPAAYVATLFNDYADHFDSHLTETLRYRGPEIVHQALLEALPQDVKELEILEVGCGTGLAGPLLKPLARRLDGVDLSSAMLARAAERGVYDRLDEGDLIATLAERAGQYDLVAGVDVLIYFGDMRPVFESAARALRPGGWLVFSAEMAELPPFRLTCNRRFEHHPDYLRGEAARVGFVEVASQRATLRYEQAQPVISGIFVFQLSPTSS